jgi:hypothetical protein
MQPNLTVIGSVTNKAATAIITPAVLRRPVTNVLTTPQNLEPIHMSASANLNDQAKTRNKCSERPASILQTSAESEDILNNLLNYEDDSFLSEFPNQEIKMQSNVEVTPCYISEPTPAFSFMPSPVTEPMMNRNYVRSPKSPSSSASSTCTCCEEHKQHSQRMVEKFTVAVDAMNQSISIAAQAVRGALDVSLDALSHVTKALQEQTMAFQQYQEITNDLIKSINGRTFANSTETSRNQPVLRENKGRNEERTDSKENKKSDTRRENSSEKKHQRQERRHHPY